MICGNCKNERNKTDFINNQKFCFRCEYRIKLEKLSEKRTSKRMFCRICSKEIIHIKNLKIRQRSVFCSPQCAEEGHRRMVSDYWTKKLRKWVWV
jgi:hypothetical protein